MAGKRKKNFVAWPEVKAGGYLDMPVGKILTPIPVFRWARGQKLSQNLLSLQLPLYEEIMHKAPDSLHTLIASGDVYIRNSEPLQDIPEVDVVCIGLWVDPALATNHGVFVSDRQTPINWTLCFRSLLWMIWGSWHRHIFS